MSERVSALDPMGVANNVLIQPILRIAAEQFPRPIAVPAHGAYGAACYSRGVQMRPLATAIALFAVLSPVAAQADLNMQPGQWEAVMTNAAGQTQPDRKCYLKKDVDAVDLFQRGIKTPSQNPCRASNYKGIGNRVQYTMSCRANGQITVNSVTMVYDATRITGEIRGVDGTITTVVNTRIGDCSQSSFAPSP